MKNDTLINAFINQSQKSYKITTATIIACNAALIKKARMVKRVLAPLMFATTLIKNNPILVAKIIPVGPSKAQESRKIKGTKRQWLSKDTSHHNMCCDFCWSAYFRYFSQSIPLLNVVLSSIDDLNVVDVFNVAILLCDYIAKLAENVS